MPDEAIQHRLDAAKALALEAGAVALHAFRRAGLRIDHKLDGTPVSEADLACERALRDAVERAFPDDAVLGEEFGAREGSTGFRWIFDPIDGTKTFLQGVPLWGTLVSVEQHLADTWEPVAGAVHMPALGEIVWGAPGLGAFWHTPDAGTRPARVSRTERLADAVIVTTGPEYIARGHGQAAWERLNDACRFTRGWSDCYGSVLVATGRAEAWFEPSVALWDVSAPRAVIHAAGGRCTDFNGAWSPEGWGTGGGSCLATNGLIHSQTLTIIAGA
ncbi:MAG: hypothetical protein HRU70_13540 [Phycisphaeraceae bacterium]|nr:MAG: hypothetical protein HRU70_13540 [Phycisphaeraceae bacterium]